MKYIKVFNESVDNKIVLLDIEDMFKNMYQELSDMDYQIDFDIMFYDGKLEKSFDDITISNNSTASIFEKFKNKNLYIAICIDIELVENEEWFTTDSNELFDIISVLRVKQDNYPKYKIFYTLDNGKITIFVLTDTLFITKEKLNLIDMIYINNITTHYSKYGKFISNNEFTIDNAVSDRIIDTDFFRQNFNVISTLGNSKIVKFK